MDTKAPDRFSIRGPGGLWLTIDRTEAFPDDPGCGTPCLVKLWGHTGTLAMASSEGILNGHKGDLPLSEKQCRWLNEVEEDAEAYVWEKDDQAVFRLKLKEIRR